MLSNAKVSDWLQIIGLFGVFGSLVFVGFQMQQTHEIALSNVYQTRANATSEMAIAAAGSPELLSALAKLYTDNSRELTTVEAVALEHHLQAIFTNIESNHRQRELGFLDEEHWRRNEENLKCWLERPVVRELISVFGFRESFETIVDEALVKAVETPTGCWDVGYFAPND